MLSLQSLWFLLSLSARLTAAVAAQSAGTEACLSCHTMPNLGYRDSAGVTRRFAISLDRFRRSAHARLTCVQCHASASSYPHARADAAARLSCDGDCHATDAAGRPYTHAPESAALRESVHGHAGDVDRPTCLACHGAGDAHAVMKTSAAPPAVRMASCVGCHDDVRMMAKHHVPTDAVASYRRSFHYKAISFGGTKTAGCTDCHTAHHVLAPSDPRSTIAQGNLTSTCGRSGCHPGARLPFAGSGANHLDLRVAREPILFIEQEFFLLLTSGTLAMLIAGIVLDIQKKFGWVALARRIASAARARARPGGAAFISHFGRLRAVLARSRRAALRAARLALYD